MGFMSGDLRREIRLAALLAVLIGGYSAVVYAIAASQDQLHIIRPKDFTGFKGLVWLVSFAFVFCAYAIDLILRRRPERPLLVMATEIRANVLRPDWLLARSSLIVGWLTLMTMFTAFKVMIGYLRGFPHDAAFAAIDRALFFGNDPWVLTHAVIGPYGTIVVQMAYNIWFMLMWLSILYLVLRPDLVTTRARYAVSFVLTWVIVGSVFAFVLGSAGPCFYEQTLGDARYAPLMERLAALDAQLAAISPSLGVHSLDLQKMLWTAYASDRQIFGGGISAMPSMHVALSVLMARAAWSIDRRAGLWLSAFAFLIWIGSIHLGWHYAIDGLLALPLTLGIWTFSGWLVDRVVMREAPAASLQPALAE